jgi:hypothetical protein
MDDPGSSRHPGWARAAHAELHDRALQLDAKLHEHYEGRALLEAQLHELRSRNVDAQYQVAAAHAGVRLRVLTGAEQQAQMLHLQGCLDAKEAQVQALQEQQGRLAMQLPGHGVGGSMQSVHACHAMQWGAWVEQGRRAVAACICSQGMLVTDHACRQACCLAFTNAACMHGASVINACMQPAWMSAHDLDASPVQPDVHLMLMAWMTTCFLS